jgi:hypothetical protein
LICLFLCFHVQVSWDIGLQGIAGVQEILALEGAGLTHGPQWVHGFCLESGSLGCQPECLGWVRRVASGVVQQDTAPIEIDRSPLLAEKDNCPSHETEPEGAWPWKRFKSPSGCLNLIAIVMRHLYHDFYFIEVLPENWPHQP